MYQSRLIRELLVKTESRIRTKEFAPVKYVKIQAFDWPDAWFKSLVEIWENGDLFQVRYGSERSLTKKPMHACN